MGDLDELYDARNDDLNEEKYEYNVTGIDYDEISLVESEGATLSDGTIISPENSTDYDILMANELYQEEISRENDARLNDLIKEAERLGYVSPDASQELKNAIERLEESKGIHLTDTISKELDITDRMDETQIKLSGIDRCNDSINEALDKLRELEKNNLLEEERTEERDSRNEEKVVSSSSEQMSRAIRSVAKK